MPRVVPFDGDGSGGAADQDSIFNVPAFFILFRETLEAAIILCIVLNILNRTIRDNAELLRRAKRHVWIGTAVGLGISLAIAIAFIAVFYTIKSNLWEDAEPLWEGILGLIATVMITLVGAFMLRMKRIQAKWERKLNKATFATLDKKSKYGLLLLPLTIVLREGLESIIFIAGVGFNGPAKSLPLPILSGIVAGMVVGYALYRGAGMLALRFFLVATTVFLLFIGAGLFTGSVHELEEYCDSERFLWKLECCSQDTHGFWMVMNALFGWRNEGTVGTVTAYFGYWAFTIVLFGAIVYVDRRRDARAARHGARAAGDDGEAELDDKQHPSVSSEAGEAGEYRAVRTDEIKSG